MKKQVLTYALVLAGASLLSITGTAIASQVNAKDTTRNSHDTNIVKLANTGELSTFNYTGKDEIVYVTTDAAGAKKSIFIGSTLYAGEDTLPYNLKISYTLDGNPISAANLAGKSGHVRISYQYESVATYQNKYVPFVAMTTVGLDTNKFTNIKLTNAKTIDEDSMLILGYGVAGLNADLGTDLLPDGFTIEADVDNFALDGAYTVLTSELLSDLDVSTLATIDGLIGSVNQLADAAGQLVSGSTALASGASELASGVQRVWNGEKSLQAGVYTLSNGITSASEGASALTDGLSQLTEKNDSLNAGASQIFDSILATTNEKLATSLAPVLAQLAPLGITLPELTQENYATAIDTFIEQTKNILPAQTSAAITQTLTTTKAKLATIENFCTGLKKYTDGVTSVSDGSTKLSDGLSTIESKIPELASGVNQLVSGTETLYRGTVELSSGAAKLRDGIVTFKSEGIDRLVNFANQNLAGFTDNVRGTVYAARSYHDFGHTGAKSVKFIIKTDKI